MDDARDAQDAAKVAPASPPMNIKGVRKSKNSQSATVEFQRGAMLGKVRPFAGIVLSPSRRLVARLALKFYSFVIIFHQCFEFRSYFVGP